MIVLPEVLQRSASDPLVSSWVGASAGSGKTKVLTDRMLRLLLSGVAADKILAITFTNAAAAEMANRLNETLAKWAIMDSHALDKALDDLNGPGAHSEDMRRQARALFARIIDSSTGVRIHTIHGFCQSVLRRFPIEAGLSPHFTLLDDRSSDELLRSVIANVLEQAAENPQTDLAQAVQRVSIYFAEDGFGKLIDEIIAQRNRFQMLFDHHEDAASRLRAFLDVPQGSDSDDLIAAACADGSFEADLLRQAAEAMLTRSTAKTDREKAEKIAHWLVLSPQDRIAGMDEYQLAFLTKEGELRAKAMTDRLAAAHPYLDEALRREAQRLYDLQKRCMAIDLARSSENLLFLARTILDEYATRKNAQGLVDYEDLILRTRALLAQDVDAAWVHYKLDGGIYHVLLDESQDTNPEQWDLIEALVREFTSGEGSVSINRTLFAVGDSKQSIFSFQRADPAIFAQMHDWFAARFAAAKKEFRAVALDISFRSTAPVLELVDKVFEPQAVYNGVADSAPHHQLQRVGAGGLVEVWPLAQRLEKTDNDPWLPQLAAAAQIDPVVASAQKIAGTIAGWLKNGEVLESQGRAVVAGDIMVLVRSRTAFVPALVRALKQLDVPVAGVDRMVLTKELAVADLLSLAQVLLLTEDDMNLAIVLRSPLVGFSDDELFAIAHGRKHSLWNALEQSSEPFAAKAIEWLHHWRSRADFIAPYELFAGILNSECPADTGGTGRRAFMARLGAEAFDPLDEFLSAAIVYEQQHPPSLQGFLGWIMTRPVEIKREPRKPVGNDAGEVTIMTVHGSKGLQAPIVFLADTASNPAGRKGSHVLWQSSGDGPAFPLWASSTKLETSHGAALRETLKLRGDEEYRRLLYVAMTRAQDRLYCVGWEGGKKIPDGCWHNLIEPAIRAIGTQQDDGSWRLAQPQTAPVKKKAKQAVATVKPDIPAFARIKPPAEAKPLRPLAPSRLVADEPASVSPLEESDLLRRFERGRLIHRLLQTLPDLPPTRWQEAAMSYLKSAASLDAAGIAGLTGEVIRVLRHPQYGIVFGPDSQAEVPIAGLISKDGQPFVLSGQIDRLVITEDEVLLIDFKSNRPPPADQDLIPKSYLMQLAAYRSALQAIYPGRVIRPALLWTNGPYLMEVPSEMLDSISLDLAP
jgi:ATP-dependent helicase/nuclease subunit A